MMPNSMLKVTKNGEKGYNRNTLALIFAAFSNQCRRVDAQGQQLVEYVFGKTLDGDESSIGIER